MLSYNRRRLVTNRSEKLDLLKPVQNAKPQPSSAVKVPSTKSNTTSHITIDYKTTLAQCPKHNPRVQDAKLHQNPLNNYSNKNIERKSTSKPNVGKESVNEQLTKRRQSSQLISEQLPKKVENYKSHAVGIAFPSIGNISLNSKNNQCGESRTHYKNFPAAVSTEICVSPTSKNNISDISQAINSVQEAWNNFVHVSRVIGKLECSMVLTKIDHVLNDEYLAYYQKHPFANDAFNEQVLSDRLKMDTLKDKISKAGDLEGVVKNLSKAIESYRMDEKKLMEELKNCKTALTSRRRLAMNSAAVIRDQLLQTSSKLKDLYDHYRKSSLELEALENDLALLLNDAHPTYSLLFRYRSDSNKEAAEEELRYMSLVYAIQQRRLGLFMPAASANEDIYEIENDSDWLWLLQYTSDNNVSCSSSGSSDGSIYEPELPNPFARQSAPNCFSQDLSAALKLGRHSFEQLYLSMPEINIEKFGNFRSTDKISMDAIIERTNGESSLLFLRRLRHRGLCLHILLGSFSQELTEKLSVLQDLKQRQGCSLIAEEFRSPTQNQDESSILSFPVIYKEDPELLTTSYDNAMASHLKKSRKQIESKSKEPFPTKQSIIEIKDTRLENEHGSSLTSSLSKDPTMPLETNKTTQFRAKPTDFLDPNVYLSTRKISSLSARSGGNCRASLSIDSSMDFNMSSSDDQILQGPGTNIEKFDGNGAALVSSADNDRGVSPIALLKDLLHSTVKKKLKNKNESENSDFVQFSTPVNDLLFNYDDLDELNKLIVKYLADKRNMNLSQDTEESLSTFNEVLKVLKVQVLSDLLKRDLVIADEIQASQVRLLTIPTIVETTPVKSIATSAIISNDNAGQGVTEELNSPPPSAPHQDTHPPKVDESLLEQFKRNGEMIFIDPTAAAAGRADSKSVKQSEVLTVEVPANSQNPTESDIKSGSDSTGNSVNLIDIYKLESFDEFIEAISNNGLADGISGADDSKRLELIKSQLSSMHKDSHVKKSNPLLPNHSTRSSCIICTHLPQIFGSFSETCLPVGNTQTVNLTDSDRPKISDGCHILATGNLPKTVHGVDGIKDGSSTVVASNKILVLNRGKSAKSSNESIKARAPSLQEAGHEDSASMISASEDKQKSYLQFCSPSRNPLSRQNTSDPYVPRQKNEHTALNLSFSGEDERSSEQKVSDLPAGSTSNVPRAYPSLNVISVHPTLTPKKSVSGDYVSPPSEIAYRSVSDEPIIHEVPDYGNTPSIANISSSKKLNGDGFHAKNISPSYDDNELKSVKLFDTLQKMHTKYFGSLQKKSRAASSKSIDDLEVEYSSPVLLKNEFIDRILLESDGPDDLTSVFQTSCDDMTTAIEEEDLTELSTLLSNYKAANPGSLSLRHIPSALSALKLFASKKKEMTLSLRNLQCDRDAESSVYTNELSQNQIAPVSFESNVPPASFGMLVGCASLSNSKHHSNVSSLSFDSTWKRSDSGSIHALKLNTAKNSRVRSDAGLQTVIEKLEMMKSQLSRNKAEHFQLSSSKLSLNDHLQGEYSQSTLLRVPNDTVDSQQLQDRELTSTLLPTEDVSTTRDRPSASIQESDIGFRKSDDDLADTSVDIFVADQRDGHSDIISPITLDELYVSEDSESAVERKAKLFGNIISRKSFTGGTNDQDNLNKVLLDFLGKQQRDIEELKKTQENIHELLQKRDVYPQSQKLPSYVSDAAAQANHPDAKSDDVMAQSVQDDAFSHKVIDVESTENKNSSPSQSGKHSEGNLVVSKSSTISWGASVKDSGESFPYNNTDSDVSHNRAHSSMHSRQPSFADSTVSALTGCTGLTSADMHTSQTSNINSSGLRKETHGSSEKTPPKLQRLRFESFLEAAQSFSPNYKYSSKSTVSPKPNNSLPNEELEEMVTFLLSKIEKYEAKKLQWSEQELLDRDTQTFAIDPTDGRSKAFVEVIVKSAKNVPAMKKVTKSSDCYVEIKLVQAKPLSSSSASAPAAIQYENKSESIYRTSVKQNTLYPDWMEDFKIFDITDLLKDKLLVTLRDSSKGSSACIGPERDEIIGQGLLHFMGGDNNDENTNVLLDQHMHCVNLTLSVPNPNFGQQPQAHVRPPAGRAPMAPMSAKKAPISSKRNSYPPTTSRTPLSPPRRELGLGTSLSNSSVMSDSHPHGCSVRLDVRLFFSKRKYWEHQQLDCTRLLYKLVGSSAPDLLQALYPQLKDFQAIHSASSSSSGITKLEIEKIRQMMLRETNTVTSPDHPAAIYGRDPESSAGLGGGTNSSITNTHKYSDILSGGSVSGMMKNMSHIRGLREKPLTTFSMHNSHQQSSRATPSTSSSRVSLSSVPLSSSPAPRTGYKRNSLSGGIGGGSIASGYTSASASSSSNNFGYGKQKHVAPYSNNAFVYSKAKMDLHRAEEDPLKMSGNLRCKSTMLGMYTELFFAAEKGELLYYEPEHHIYKGKYSLGDMYIVKIDKKVTAPEEKKIIRIKSTNGLFKTYVVLLANSSKIRRLWVQVLQSNIEYATFHRLYMTIHQAEVNDLSLFQRGGSLSQASSDERLGPRPGGNSFQREDDDFSDDESTTVENFTELTEKIDISSSNQTSVNLEVDSLSPSSLKGTVRSADNLPPAVIRDRHTGREILFQYVLSLPPPTTAAEKTQLPTPSISGTSQQQCIPICAGWLQKRGDIFKTLRRRYFVLENGLLKWFRAEPQASSAPRGSLNIYDYQLYSDYPAGKIRLILMPGYSSTVKRKLLLYCENYEEKSIWVRAINQHSSYIQSSGNSYSKSKT